MLLLGKKQHGQSKPFHQGWSCRHIAQWDSHHRRDPQLYSTCCDLETLFFKGLLHPHAWCSREAWGNKGKGKEPHYEVKGD